MLIFTPVFIILDFNWNFDLYDCLSWPTFKEFDWTFNSLDDLFWAGEADSKWIIFHFRHALLLTQLLERFEKIFYPILFYPDPKISYCCIKYMTWIRITTLIRLYVYHWTNWAFWLAIIFLFTSNMFLLHWNNLTFAIDTNLILEIVMILTEFIFLWWCLWYKLESNLNETILIIILHRILDNVWQS